MVIIGLMCTLLNIVRRCELKVRLYAVETDIFAVEPEDKSAGMVIVVSAVSLIALLPSPIIVGKLLGEAQTH